MDKAVVLGAAHGNATHISDDHVREDSSCFTNYHRFKDLIIYMWLFIQFSIDDDDYIEAVEGTYTKSHITSLTFWLHKNKVNHHYGFRSAFERSLICAPRRRRLKDHRLLRKKLRPTPHCSRCSLQQSYKLINTLSVLLF